MRKADSFRQAKIFLVCLLAFCSLGAKANRVKAPLMPPRGSGDGNFSESNDVAKPAAKSAEPVLAVAPVFAGGGALGALGRNSATTGDVAGLDLFLGGRAESIFSIGFDFYLQPSLGYFWRSSGSAPTVTENLLEAGLVAHYSLLGDSNWRWLVGAAQRVQMLSTQTAGTLYTSPISSGWVFQYRVGPATAWQYAISDILWWTLAAEMTWGFGTTGNSYVGLTTGILFAFE